MLVTTSSRRVKGVSGPWVSSRCAIFFCLHLELRTNSSGLGFREGYAVGAGGRLAPASVTQPLATAAATGLFPGSVKHGV